MSTTGSTVMMNSIAHMQRNHNLAMSAIGNAFRPTKSALPRLKDVLEHGKAAGILMEAIRFLENGAPMEDDHILDSLERALREAREVFVKTTAKFERLCDEDQTQSIFTVACIAKELIFDWQKPLA